MIYKHFDLLSQAENKKKCGWRISFKNRTADFFIKFNISQTKMKTILSFSKGKCDTRYPHYSVLMSIPLLKTRTVADENPPRKNCCYLLPFWTVTYACNWVYTLRPPKNFFERRYKEYVKKKAGSRICSRAQKLILLFYEMDKMKKLNY